jgi:hypothetical protein
MNENGASIYGEKASKNSLALKIGSSFNGPDKWQKRQLTLNTSALHKAALNFIHHNEIFAEFFLKLTVKIRA